MHRCGAQRTGGFTLVELMVGMTLSLLLGAAIISVFLFNRQSFSQDEIVQRMQDDARHAVRQLTTDLSMAGFWADLLVSDAITPDDSLAVAVECGPVGVAEWIYQLDESMSFVDNATGATASASFACIDPDEIVPGTDVISIKRVAGATTGAAVADTVYLRTNGTLGLLFREPANAPPAVDVPAPFTEWEYRSSIYYVRNYGVFTWDDVPTLCRKVLQFAAPPTMRTECLAQGVENLQIEFGLDVDDDGNPNVFVANPTAAQLQTAVAARIHVLVRGAEPDRAYTNDKTYSIGNAPAYTPADNFYRRVYSVTVGMHNRRASLALGS